MGFGSIITIRNNALAVIACAAKYPAVRKLFWIDDVDGLASTSS
jgi:hypothetical protein